MKQLELIDSDLILNVINNIESIVVESGSEISFSRKDDCIILYSESFFRKLLNVVSDISKMLNEEENLFGFKSLITEIKNKMKVGIDSILDKLCKASGRIEDDNETYMLESMYNEYFTVENSKGYKRGNWIVIDGASYVKIEKKILNKDNFRQMDKSSRSEDGLKTEKLSGAKLKSLNRDREIEKILDGISSRLNNPEKDEAVYVFGYRGVGKTASVISAIGEVLGKDEKDSFIYFSATLKGSSPLHPFINGLKGKFLDTTHEYLVSVERKIWDSKKGLIEALNGSNEQFVPDYVVEDFMTLLHLYLLSFIKRMQKNDLPAFVVFDDIELYHSVARKYILTFMRDFLCYDSFIPILVSSDKELLEAYDEFCLRKVYISPLNWRNILEIATEMKIAHELTEKRVKYLRRLTEGKIIPVVVTLYYMKNSGDFNVSDIKVCFKYLIDKLDMESISILYTFELTKVIFSYEKQFEYLLNIGFKREDLDKKIELLRDLFLISVKKSAGYSIPLIGSYIEEKAKTKLDKLREDLSKYILDLFERKKYSNYIYLYYFLTKNGMIDPARSLFKFIMERKINERDFTGCLVFLKGRFTKLLKWNKQKEKALTTLIKLKLAYLESRIADARKFVKEMEYLKETLEPDEFAEYKLYLSYLKTSLGEDSEALEYGKDALFYFEERGDECNSSRAFESLGLNMLARGKLDDAMDYFSMASGVNCGNNQLIKVETIAFHGITNFIRGDLALSLNYVGKGMEVADKIFSREWGLFLRFFLARIKFEFGRYDEAREVLESALGFESMYQINRARYVIYSWLSRCFTYSGKPLIGLKILEPMEESLLKSLFLAEAYYFSAQYEKAFGTLEVFDEIFYEKQYNEGKIVPGVRHLWKDGFSGIEGRSYELSGEIIVNYAMSLKAHIGSILERNTIDIHAELVRNRKHPPFDPFLHVYYFLYSESLSAGNQGVGSDKFTVLNRAWKILQERSNRIGDAKMRRDYIEKNYWNKLLYDAAIASKLV